MILTDAIERNDYDIELTTDGIAITHKPSGAQFTVGSDGSVTANALGASGTNLTLGSNTDIGNATTIGNVAAQQIDAQSSNNPDAVAVDSQLYAKDVIDEGKRLNDLYRAIGQSQFELGLTQLEYDTGQFDTFADNSKVDSQSGISIDGSVTLIEPLTFGNVDAEFTGHTSSVLSVFIDGSYGYSGSYDNTVKKWDTDTMSQQNEFTGHADNVWSVHIDGSFGYSVSRDSTVKKWDTDTMTEQAEFTGHADNVLSVFIDGSYGYSGSYDNTVKKWDTDTMSQQNEFTGHADNVWSVHIDGSFGYSVSADSTVKKWDTDTMTEQNEFTGHTDKVQSVYIDGSYGYSGSSDGSVKKWDTDTMTEQAEFTGHADNVLSVYIDGSYGYSGSYDNTVKQWDTDTMTEQAEFTGHTNSVYSVFIDGSYGYSASGDGSVKKWDNTDRSGSTQGSAAYAFTDLDFVPDKAVLSIEDTPNDGDITFEVEDDSGNVQSITNPDTEVTLDQITTSTVRSAVYIDRPSESDTSPEVDSYALYLTEE